MKRTSDTPKNFYYFYRPRPASFYWFSFFDARQARAAQRALRRAHTPNCPATLASLVQRHGLATQLRVSSRVFSFSPWHTTSSSALVATASAAENLLPPASYLFSRKAANFAWSAALPAAFDAYSMPLAALFLPRPPPRLPPPRPRPLKMAPRPPRPLSLQAKRLTRPLVAEDASQVTDLWSWQL